MATINSTSVNVGRGAVVFTWTPVTEADTAAPISLEGGAPALMQVEGTFGAGGTVVLNGSADGAARHPLANEGGTAISITAAGITTVRERPRDVQPAVSAGTGVSVTISLMVVRD